MDRRQFLKTGTWTAASLFAFRKPLWGAEAPPDLVVVENGEPRQLVREAVRQMGGMGRFISRGDVVVIKPNMSWDRLPEQAANTNPEVVAEVVRLCFEAGAKRVKLFDNTLNEPKRCYTRSGIEAAAKAEGAEVEYINERKFVEASFPEGVLIKSWPVYRDILEADKVINLPIAKHHSIGGVSLAMKNLMGVLGGVRGRFHRDFHTKIVDLNGRIRPHLVILDAYRMLIRNGPSGGNLADVRLRKTLVLGTDPVAVDSYGVRLFEDDPFQKTFLVEAAMRGLGQCDLSKLRIKTVTLSS